MVAAYSRLIRGIAVLAVLAVFSASLVACGADPTPTPRPAATPTPTSQPAAGPTPTSQPAAGPTPTSQPAATPTPTVDTFQVDWDATLAAAREEGKVVVVVTRATYREGIENFQSYYPGITVETVVGRGLEERFIREYQAGIHSADVYMLLSAILETLGPAGIAGDTRAQLIHPEVVGDDNWVGTLNDHFCDDQTGRNKQFCMQATPGGITFYADENVLPAGQFDTFDDLLDPELAEKGWCLLDPRERGAGQGWFAQLVAVKGKDFARQVLTETNVTLHNDRPQAAKDLVRGQYAACVGADIDDLTAEGLAPHIRNVSFPTPGLGPEYADAGIKSTCCGDGAGQDTFEGFFNSGFGGPAIFKDPPNPNAAKIFINWLLTEQGSTDFLGAFDFRDCSSRDDLHNSDRCPRDDRLKENGSYLSFDRESTSFIEVEANSLAEEALGGR